MPAGTHRSRSQHPTGSKGAHLYTESSTGTDVLTCSWRFSSPVYRISIHRRITPLCHDVQVCRAERRQVHPDLCQLLNRMHQEPIQWMYYQLSLTTVTQTSTANLAPGCSTFRPPASCCAVYLKYIKHISVVTPLNYVPYHKADAMQLLIDKFGCSRSTKHFESRFTRFYEGYWLPRKFGYDTRRVQYSSLIRYRAEDTRGGACTSFSSPALDDETARQGVRSMSPPVLAFRSASCRATWMHQTNPIGTINRSRASTPLAPTLMCLFGLERGGKRSISIVNYGLGNTQAFIHLQAARHSAYGGGSTAAELRNAHRHHSCPESAPLTWP